MHNEVWGCAEILPNAVQFNSSYMQNITSLRLCRAVV